MAKRPPRRISEKPPPTSGERRKTKSKKPLSGEIERRKAIRRETVRRKGPAEKEKVKLFTQAIKHGISEKILAVCSDCGAVKLDDKFFEIGVTKERWEGIAEKKGFVISHSFCKRCHEKWYPELVH